MCIPCVRVNRSSQSRAQKGWRSNFPIPLILKKCRCSRQGKDSCFFSFTKLVTCAVKWDGGKQIQEWPMLNTHLKKQTELVQHSKCRQWKCYLKILILPNQARAFIYAKTKKRFCVRVCHLNGTQVSCLHTLWLIKIVSEHSFFGFVLVFVYNLLTHNPHKGQDYLHVEEVAFLKCHVRYKNPQATNRLKTISRRVLTCSEQG